jgi:hypothetical protein
MTGYTTQIFTGALDIGSAMKLEVGFGIFLFTKTLDIR